MKLTKPLVFSILFLLVTLVDLYAVFFKLETVEFIAKPLITVVLALLYLVSVKKANFWLLSGLCFSFWGDVLLLFDLPNFFIFGLVSFLIAHVLYIKMTLNFIKDKKLNLFIKASVPFVMFLIGLLWFVKDGAGEMFIPVAVYGVVISVFGTMALVNYQQQKNTANLWLLLGALIFMFSDSLIAVGKFSGMQIDFGIFIMLTYCIAQYLIVKSLISK